MMMMLMMMTVLVGVVGVVGVVGIGMRGDVGARVCWGGLGSGGAV